VYVIKGEQVRWMPAVDLNHALTVWGTVVITVALSRMLFGRRRRRAQESKHGHAGGAT
jgi:hypothetical protein